MKKFWKTWKSHGVLKKLLEISKSPLFKLLIIILENSDSVKKQKEKGKEKLRKRQISDKMQELKEKKRKIQLKKQNELEGIEDEIHELIKAR